MAIRLKFTVAPLGSYDRVVVSTVLNGTKAGGWGESRDAPNSDFGWILNIRSIRVA